MLIFLAVTTAWIFISIPIVRAAGSIPFGSAVNYEVGANPRCVVSADFNGDGSIDLAVANAGGNNVSILLGNGDGTFAPDSTLGAGTSPCFVTAADFDKDENVDLAAANRSSDNISVFQGGVGFSFGDSGFLPVGPLAAGLSAFLVWRKCRRQE
ncbi:MAG: VCBS repeat-containing protein [Candidatus Omnitrophota bacterium]